MAARPRAAAEDAAAEPVDESGKKRDAGNRGGMRRMLRGGAVRVSLASPGQTAEPFNNMVGVVGGRGVSVPKMNEEDQPQGDGIRGWFSNKFDGAKGFVKGASSFWDIRKYLNGWSTVTFGKEALEVLSRVNVSVAHGDAASVRRLVTSKMFSVRLVQCPYGCRTCRVDALQQNA